MDRSKDLTGEFGPGHYFSDLYVECIRLEFTGGILVWDEGQGCEGKIFFTAGSPFHVSGELFHGSDLGEVLRKLGAVTNEDIEMAVAAQAAQSNRDRELLGALLAKEANLDDSALDAALGIQTKKRLIRAFAVKEGMWRGLWSKRDNIVSKGVPVPGYSVLAPGLTEHASDDELRRYSDDLLGHAVKMTCTLEDARDIGADDAHEEVLTMLLKPRKPDQIERATGMRREVRALLKALELAERLERLPAHKGVPLKSKRKKIPTALTHSARISRPATGDEARRPSAAPPRSQPSSPPPAAVPERPSVEAQALTKEIEALRKTIDDKNYFELLGATQDATPRDLRSRYTDLVRKYHPDRLTQAGLSAEVLDHAATISSKLNDAYQTLTDGDRRAEYMKLVGDRRIQGRANKVGLVEEAEKKFRMAQILIKKRDFAAAREMLNFSTESVPNDGRFKAYLAWALWLDPNLLQDVVAPRVTDLLKDAVRLAPDDPDANYFLGSVFKVTGDINGAARHFKRVVKLDRNHVEATRELRLMHMRKKR